jgi:uroporphyrinogen decarboxylase
MWNPYQPNLELHVDMILCDSNLGDFYRHEACEQYLSFLPYDIAILEEMKGIVRMLHACKSHLDLNRIKSYPHEVLSWADKDSTCPTMAEVRGISDKCLMGGIDQSNVIEQTVDEIQEDINSAVSVNKGKNFILSPGCTIGSNVPNHVLDSISSFTNNVRI